MTKKNCLGLILVALFFGTGTASVRADEPIKLVSKRAVGGTDRVEALLEVGGELSLVEEEKVKKLKMSVVGNMHYDEKLLAGGSDATTLRAIRRYDRADAVIKIEKGGVKPKLRDDRLMVGVQITPELATTFSPLGALSRDELDLLELPGNSLLLDQVLPAEAVGPGDQWPLPETFLASFVGVDAINQTDVICELKEIQGNAAKIEFRGKVQAAVGGVSTELDVQGRCKFDLTQQRITWLALLIDEKRSIGHVSPGLDVVARLQMTIKPDSPAPALSEASLADLVLIPTEEMTQLTFESTLGRFRFDHTRDWHVMNETSEGVALRLVQRGELMAQCNVSPLPQTAPEKIVTLAKFQQDVERSLGKNFQQFVKAAQSSHRLGYSVYRLEAIGEVSELPIQWNYYLVADDRGNQVVFAFTLEAELVEKFAGADRALVDSFRFALTTTASAGEPTPVR